MTYLPRGTVTKDDNNSSTSTLTASSTFTGTSTDVLNYHQVHVTVYQEPNVTPNGDANTAKGSMYLEFSPDDTNWDISIPIFVRSGINIPQTLVVVDRYFRVRYINDGGAAAIASLGLTETADTARNQTAFRLTTYLVPSGTKELGRTVDQSVTGSDPVSVVRAIIMGKDPDGSYVNTPVADAGEFVVANYGLEVARANQTGREGVRVFGRNGSVGTTEEDLWAAGGAYNFLQTADTLQIAAGGDPNDDAAGGSHAREIHIYGLDASGDPADEALATNGALASLTTGTSYLRVNKVVVTNVGGYGNSNSGAITIETNGTNTTVAQIPAGVGRAVLGIYTVKNGAKGYITRVRVMPEGNKDADVFLYIREEMDVTSAPMRAVVRILTFDQIAGGTSDGFTLEYPIEVPGKSDIWLAGQVASGTGAISGAFDLELVDD